MNLDAVRLVLQLALGGVFLVSAAGKLRHPLAFLEGVAEYEILPAPLAYGFGAVLIPLEALLALAYLTGAAAGLAGPLTVALLLIFASAVTVSLLRNRDLRCHCYGTLSDERVSARSLLQLALLLGAALLVWSGGHPPSGPSDVALALVWALSCLLAARWLLAADEIVRLFRHHRCATCARAGAAPSGQP